MIKEIMEDSEIVGKHQNPQNQLMRNNRYELSHTKDINLNSIYLHSHDFYEIYFFVSGKTIYSVENLHYNLISGDILLIPANVLHQLEIKDTSVPYERIVLWLNPRYLAELSSKKTDLAECFSSCLENRSFLLRDYFLSSKIREKLLFLKHLEMLENEKDFGVDIEKEQSIRSMLLDINRFFYSANFDPPATNARYAHRSSHIVSGAMDYIEKNLTQDLSLDSIANHIFVSKYHLAHSFKEETNITVHQFVVKKRLLLAKKYIERGKSIKELYEICGFKDESTFFRLFKSEFGITPKQYRQYKNLI